MDNKFERVAENSPERCEATTGIGQCPYKVSAPSKFCPMHGGHLAVDKHKAESLRMLRLSKWQGRMSEFADHDKVKSLREEIGILRIMLEETVNRCGDQVELIMNSGKIADLVMKIEKLVTSCHKLESNLGLMLDKQAAMQLSGEIVDIIGRHISDESIISKIANDIGAALSRAGNSLKDSG